MSKRTDEMAEKAKLAAEAKYEQEKKNQENRALRQRMDVARAGVVAYQAKNYREAVNRYYEYLGILERWKGVKKGALEPKLFDSKRDIAELLLLSGIYWDLAKLQDRSKSKERNTLKSHLDKFYGFSKGMPYQHMCKELLRKYVMNERAVNHAIFKDTYIRLGGGRCFIATAVEEHCSPNTVPNLRSFRDQVLLKKTGGKFFVRVYYRLSPNMARILLRSPIQVQRAVALVLDRIAQKLPK